MTETMDPEELWNRLLSEKPALIRSAWRMLGPQERESIRRHLQIMTCEEGWHPNQRRAARAAVDCLEKIQDE